MNTSNSDTEFQLTSSNKTQHQNSFLRPLLSAEEPGYLSGIALGYGLGDRGFESRQELGIFLFTTASRTALGPTQLPIQWVPAALSLGVTRQEREADRSPPFSAEVKEYMELYLHSPNTSSWCGAKRKHRSNFTFYFLQLCIW
jgi:hypothetical protein